jgi:D-alanyl-lipoteichoic acid acyltransferase DltB (MBOAT superfamily)
MTSSFPLLAVSPPLIAADPRAERAATDPFKFAVLASQLLLLLVVTYLFQVEERAYLRLLALLSGLFVVHYWLPFGWKAPFWLAGSLAGAFVLLEAATASLLLATGALLYAIARSRLAHAVKVAAIAAVGASMALGRAVEPDGIPTQFWVMVGALFMFRLIVYTYELGQKGHRPSALEFFSYFFLLPNFYFVLFPVIDFQTLRKGYYGRDIHVMAQQGLAWMVRGTLHLLLYRVVYHLKPSATTDAITSLPQLILVMVLTYALYLRVSGQFHIIVGSLHLFGYDLPETNRKYFLAQSFADLWRRINIYWKDFMVKVVFFPVYFRMRRRGELKAQVVATGAVFVVTWFLHAYQGFWLHGSMRFSWPDTVFWATLGALVIVNLLVERRRSVRTGARAPVPAVVRAGKVTVTFVTMCLLWSLWSSGSLAEWIDLMTWWRVG